MVPTLDVSRHEPKTIPPVRAAKPFDGVCMQNKVANTCKALFLSLGERSENSQAAA